MADASIVKGKSLWGAAVLNFFLPGLGYLYVGRKRTLLGVGLLVSSVAGYLSPTVWSKTEIDFPILLSAAIFSTIVAVDAWKDAEETKAPSSV